jgi:hypothetical protein
MDIGNERVIQIKFSFHLVNAGLAVIIVITYSSNYFYKYSFSINTKKFPLSFIKAITHIKLIKTGVLLTYMSGSYFNRYIPLVRSGI